VWVDEKEQKWQHCRILYISGRSLGERCFPKKTYVGTCKGVQKSVMKQRGAGTTAGIPKIV